MKLIAYAARTYEAETFERLSREFDIEVTQVPENLGPDNVALARGFDGVSTLADCKANADILQQLASGGTRFIVARSAGYNNIDAAAARRLGIRFSNATYSPNSVADFAVMLILMCVRKAKLILARTSTQDFSLEGTQGREMHNLTVGIIGTGRIGATTAQNLSGFGCRILACDIYQNRDLDKILTYVDLEELLAQSDIITLHTALTPESKHLINTETIGRMKDKVVIVNCSRGDLINTDDLIDAIESGKISAAGLDVIEDEAGIFHHDHRLNILKHRQLAILRSFPNVLVTAHSAFSTDQAVSDRVEVAFRSLSSFVKTGQSPWEIH